ncbi:hypothetical protein K0M31_005988 [Melipona bicolor]|uniref:Uncharacterized protein n=1 Tax=Melipona bicolor TaxID=60889 RepID=A0AA40KLA7_9HYME|nr:hypothetical protein K0M31_005988 [Melipona bicolor]
MDRDRENAKVETPIDVSTEIEKVVAAAERGRSCVDGCQERRDTARKRNEQRHEPPRNEEEQKKEEEEEEEKEEQLVIRRERIHRQDGVVATRNPLSKFSTCGARETPRKVRVATMPEVRLLGESRSSK